MQEIVESLKPYKEGVTEYGNTVVNGITETRAQIPALPFTRCVTLNQLLNLSVPQLLHLLMKVKKTH